MTERRLKILLLAGRFEVRASSAYTLRLARHLPAYGLEPRIACIDATKLSPEARQNLPIATYSRLDVPLWGRMVFEVLCGDFAGDPPDVIHAQSLFAAPYAIALARRLGRPCVTTISSSPPEPRRLSEVERGCDRVIAISSAIREEIVRKNRFRSEQVTVIPSGVDVIEEDHLREVLAEGEIPVVGTAGPLEVVKGLPYFLGAAARLVQTHANLQFLISGAGPEEHNLRRLARELGLAACVTFVSNLHDFSRSISAIDIFCLPSLQQGLGATMLEAMALGRPVIATNVGGIESIITDGQNGLLVPPSDSKLLAARIAELVDDPVKARRIGATGREHVREHFRVATMVEKTAALYRSVADDRLTKIDRTEKPVSLSEMTPH